MIPCMPRTRKRVRGKNEQTQRCSCLLRCAPECGISILTCGQSLERFLPAFFNKRGKSGCWIPSQASTARSMEWSGGQEGLQGSGPGAGGPVLSAGSAAGTLPPCGRHLKSIRRKKRRRKLPRCSRIRLQMNKQKNAAPVWLERHFFWCQEFFSMYTLVEGKAKSTPSACMISMIFRFRSFCICRNSA